MLQRKIRIILESLTLDVHLPYSDIQHRRYHRYPWHLRQEHRRSAERFQEDCHYRRRCYRDPGHRYQGHRLSIERLEEHRCYRYNGEGEHM